jgi:putative (di)nucleoside polyphosphate hydrolase
MKRSPKNARARATGRPARRRVRRDISRWRGVKTGGGFIRLLAEPEIQLLMKADLVDKKGLLSSLNAVSRRLRKSAAKRPVSRVNGRSRKHKSDDEKYRPGIGIMLINRRGEVFVGRRSDVDGEAWQMPQGGIDPGEEPRDAVFRELKEEVGTDNAEILAEAADWLYYELPPRIAKQAWDGRWIGQKQKWFVLIFKGEDAEIDLTTHLPEFSAWRWVPVHELPKLAVSFKRQLYLSLLGQFSTIFRD